MLTFAIKVVAVVVVDVVDEMTGSTLTEKKGEFRKTTLTLACVERFAVVLKVSVCRSICREYMSEK